MTKKIFTIVLTLCVLGTIIGGCSKPDDSATPAATATATAGGTTTGK